MVLVNAESFCMANLGPATAGWGADFFGAKNMSGDLFSLAPLSVRDSIHGKDDGADWVRSMFSQKDYGSGYTYPSVGGFIDLDPLPLPNLDGDDPSMGLDIMTSSESCNSTSRDYETHTDAAPSAIINDWAQRTVQKRSPKHSQQSKVATVTKFADIEPVVQSKPPAGRLQHPCSPTSSLDDSLSVATDPGNSASTDDESAATGMSRSASFPSMRIAPAPVRVPSAARRTVKSKPKTSSPKASISPVLSISANHRRINKRDKGARIVCVNCNSSSTPQWRMGPTGPKTLCNACGVRFKKGLPLRMSSML